MKIEFTQEKRGEVERIQKEFANQLSPTEILKGTAAAINDVLRGGISNREKGINAAIKREYNIAQKYLSRQAEVKPKANKNRLYGGIMVNEMKLPIIAFKPKQKKSDISVEIRKGQKKTMRNTFIATMANDHKGAFSRGEYVGRTFLYYGKGTPRGVRYTPASDYMKQRITQRMGPAVFSMATNKDVVESVQDFMGSEVSARVHGILTSRVNKIAAKNNG